MDWIKAHMLSLVLTALPIGGIAFLAVQWMKRTFTGIDEHSAFLKRSYVVAGASALAILSTALGLGVPCDPSAAVAVASQCLANLPQPVIETMIKAILGMGAAFVLHAGKDSTT